MTGRGGRTMPSSSLFNKPDRYLVWLASNATLTAAVAWMAFQLQQEEIAPAVLFPLLVGAALGAGGAAIARFSRLGGARAAICGAVVWGLLVVIGQDYIGHRRRARLYDESLNRQDAAVAGALAQNAEMQPRFDQFLAGRVRAHPLWWSLDVVLTCGASAAVTALCAKHKQSPTSGEA
jgi:hypothetical protein